MRPLTHGPKLPIFSFASPLATVKDAPSTLNPSNPHRTRPAMPASPLPPGAPNPPKPDIPAWRAVERLYHALLTGLILAAVTRRGSADAAELVFRLFRRQHLERFLPGLKKLGLDRLPHAVACAQYHYLSNKLGGVKVEYIPESDRKAWVRYPPPRWIWEGTAICGIPSEVSRAMLRAWHAHNGVSLGNPRLGFVCTKQTVDGQPGLEGYYHEADRDLAPDERLRFAPDEEAPPCDPALEPSLESDAWPEERLQKVLRNYAMDYIRNIIPEALALFGPGEGSDLVAFAARRIGMQFYDETAALFGITGDSPEAFAHYLARIANAQGDGATVSPPAHSAATVPLPDDASYTVECREWGLMRGLTDFPPEAFIAWNELWIGALSVHNRFLFLETTPPNFATDAAFVWRIQRR